MFVAKDSIPLVQFVVKAYCLWVLKSSVTKMNFECGSPTNHFKTKVSCYENPLLSEKELVR